MTGSIKDFTTNFQFIIPEFNIATWHDYIEQNFRSIDALFNNLFGINGFSGMWKTNSQYTAGQVLFVGEDGGSIYEGRLVKVVNDTSTGGFSTFSEAVEAHPGDYEFFTDASSAQLFSELARDWANKTDGTVKTPEGDDTGEYSAKKYAQDSQSSATDSEYFKNLAQTCQEIAQSAATDSETSAQNSETSAQHALVSEQNSKTSETNAKTSEQNAAVSAQNAFSYAESVNPNNLLNKNMITNCLTEIPQDIKLELNNGTLTLKAGSKVYVPNGVGVFDEVVIESDKTFSTAYTSSVACYAIYDVTAKTIRIFSLGDSNFSYDTTSNKIVYTTLPNQLLSFPFALVHRDTTGIGSLDQVFNGFGYIGRNPFGIGFKGLMSDGYNQDGTYKNIEVVGNVNVHPIVGNGTFYLQASGSGTITTTFKNRYYKQPTPPAFAASSCWEDTQNNVIWKSIASSTGWTNGTSFKVINVGEFVSENNSITSFNPKTNFQAVDYNSIAQHVVVSTLPASPDSNTFYYIPG